jgi:hypothetical protein
MEIMRLRKVSEKFVSFPMSPYSLTQEDNTHQVLHFSPKGNTVGIINLNM